MRIGIDARMYGAASTTGIGFYLQQLIEQLAIIDQKNQYFLLMRRPALGQFKSPSDRVVAIKADLPWYSYREQLQLPLLLRRHRLDLVHFPHFNVPIGYRRPFVVTIHDLTPMAFPGPKVKRSPWRRRAYQQVFQSGLRRAKRIIAISNHTRQQLITQAGVAADRIEVIYPGVSERYQPQPDGQQLETLRQRLGITKPFILYVGVWRDHKNLPSLVEAFNRLKTRHRLDLQLVLAGRPDPRYPEIQAAITRSPFKADIITPGFIADENLPSLYRAAKLFVLPSFNEGFGLVAAESAACGTPVVGSNTTSLPEILGDAGWYVNPLKPGELATVINRAITDEAAYQKARQRGLEVVKRYDWRRCAEQTLAVYEKVKP